MADDILQADNLSVVGAMVSLDVDLPHVSEEVSGRIVPRNMMVLEISDNLASEDSALSP